MDPSSTPASEIIRVLNLQPHPEKGFYIQTFVDQPAPSPSPSTSTSPNFPTPHPTTSRPSSSTSPPETPQQPGQRPQSTAIYYLLPQDTVSHWHRVLDAVEIWHFYAGAPLELSLAWDERDGNGEAGGDGGEAGSAERGIRKAVLGPDVLAGQRPQIIVRRGEWQRAVSLGAWTLVGCTVSPGFSFEAFEMAEEGWEPRQ